MDPAAPYPGGRTSRPMALAMMALAFDFRVGLAPCHAFRFGRRRHPAWPRWQSINDGRMPMNAAIRAAARLAPTSGVVVGVWLILSGSTGGLGAFLPAAVAAAEPEPVQLAQADAAPTGSPVSYSSDQVDRGEK